MEKELVLEIKNLNEKLDHIYDSIDKVLEKVDRLSEQLSKLSRVIGEHEVKIDKIEKSIDEVKLNNKSDIDNVWGEFRRKDKLIWTTLVAGIVFLGKVIYDLIIKK